MADDADDDADDNDNNEVFTDEEQLEMLKAVVVAFLRATSTLVLHMSLCDRHPCPRCAKLADESNTHESILKLAVGYTEAHSNG